MSAPTNIPTPRTDTFVKDKQCPDVYSQDWADEITEHARQLERELIAAERCVEALRRVQRDIKTSSLDHTIYTCEQVEEALAEYDKMKGLK